MKCEEKGSHMNTSVIRDPEVEGKFDVVEEMRLRTWARQNYAPTEQRDKEWHPVILDEMKRKDKEAVSQNTVLAS